MSCSADLVAAYASLFIQRWDVYAVQQPDGSYRPIYEPLTPERIAGHLMGRYTLGTYVLDQEGYCSFAVFDADRDDGLTTLVELAEELALDGIPTLLEASRRGGHLWLHFENPTPARVVRHWLLPSAVLRGLELYPKQDQVGPGGLGSLIRLPLGVHRRSKGWYPFVVSSATWGLVPAGETVMGCCLWAVSQVQRVQVPVGETQTGPYQARQETHWGAGLGASGGPGRIDAWCESQDIVSVIGRYVCLDQRGVGSCPFKEHHAHGDRHPSFQVFAGTDPHWYCYTWGRAGNLFNFLCLYHGLSPQEGWRRVQEGTLPV